MSERPVVIIGGGPAGLTASYELAKAGKRSVVLEKDDILGGLARTVEHEGYRFDIGGHRFFTKVQRVDRWWHDVMEESDYLLRSRLSRIYYRKKFFYYPIKIGNAFVNLGPIQAALIFLSYLRAKARPVRPEVTFEDWVTNRLGGRLYRTFFKSYTEKVWGMPCNEIAADWAAQRIKGLSLWDAVKNALPGPKKKGGEVIKTLIDQFHYPRLGPGQMWETVAELIRAHGSEVRLESPVERIEWSDGAIDRVIVGVNGSQEAVEGSHFVSSMPLRHLIQRLHPAPPKEILEAAKALRYRDFLTVALVLDREDLFPDNWIYIHDPEVLVGRIQNFKNWSPDMVPDQSRTCLGLEYFCFQGDTLWSMPDEELINLGARELDAIGLLNGAKVLSGAVVRAPKAYPVYDSKYRDAVEVLRGFLEGIPNLQVIGRNGMHKYNNQDHSMLTAMLAAENILGGNRDLWEVNEDKEYHEAKVMPAQEGLAELAATQPRVPRPASSATRSDPD